MAKPTVEFHYTFSDIWQQNPMKIGWSPEPREAPQRTYTAGPTFFFYPIYAKAARPERYFQTIHVSGMLFISSFDMKTHVSNLLC